MPKPQVSDQVSASRKDRALREIALAEATGARAVAAPDFSVVFVRRPDGSEERVRIPMPDGDARDDA